MSPRAATKTDSRLAARFAALASLGAAVIHFAVVPTHWHEWLPSGLFFVGVASFQLLWARAVLTRPTTAVLVAGMTLNIAAVTLWALTRTVGAPFGPHAGRAEIIQAADLCALLLQIYVVMGAGWVWHRRHQGQPISAFANAIILLGAGAVVALASTVGVASGLRHGHGGTHGEEAAHHDAVGGHTEGHHVHSVPGDASPAVEPIPTPAAPAHVPPPVPVAEPLQHDSAGDHHHGD